MSSSKSAGQHFHRFMTPYCWSLLSPGSRRTSDCWWPECERPRWLQTRTQHSRWLNKGYTVWSLSRGNRVSEWKKPRAFQSTAACACGDSLRSRVGIFPLLPARSHSSVSVALDNASSSSGSRVVTSSWRRSIGFCLGTNILPKKKTKRWNGWVLFNTHAARSANMFTAKPGLGFMRFYTTSVFKIVKLVSVCLLALSHETSRI